MQARFSVHVFIYYLFIYLLVYYTAQCIVIAPVSVCVCLFVGPPYYSQRAVASEACSLLQCCGDLVW